MEKGRSVTLKHLLIQERRYIGLQFNTDKVIHALVKQLPDGAIPITWLTF